jgi:hypothetical protein
MTKEQLLLIGINTLLGLIGLLLSRHVKHQDQFNKDVAAELKLRVTEAQCKERIDHCGACDGVERLDGRGDKLEHMIRTHGHTGLPATSVVVIKE